MLKLGFVGTTSISKSCCTATCTARGKLLDRYLCRGWRVWICSGLNGPGNTGDDGQRGPIFYTPLYLVSKVGAGCTILVSRPCTIQAWCYYLLLKPLGLARAVGEEMHVYIFLHTHIWYQGSFQFPLSSYQHMVSGKFPNSTQGTCAFNNIFILLKNSSSLLLSWLIILALIIATLIIVALIPFIIIFINQYQKKLT